MKVVTIIQARMGSTRLPGKVLKDVGGEPILAHVVARANAIANSHETVVATTVQPEDDVIEALCRQRGWPRFRGSPEDVLERYCEAAVRHSADHVVRVTADCPLVCHEQGQHVVAHHLATGAAFTHNVTAFGSSMPVGTGIEVFTLETLERSRHEGHEPHHREHVDEYAGEHPERFSTQRVEPPLPLRRPELRLTVDEESDLRFIRAIHARLGHPGPMVALLDVVRLLDGDPNLAAKG